MTVKEIVSVLEDAKSINIGYDGILVPFCPDDRISMAAYGKFVVEKVYACGEDKFELYLAMEPVIGG